MARPILNEVPTRDPRAELRSRLDEAPEAHAEALLAMYEVLQGLHDRGVLEILRGALGSSDKVLEIAVEAAKSPTSIRGLRNLFLVVNLLGAIDPEELAAITKTLPLALDAMEREKKPAGLWTLTRRMLWDQEIRRGLSALTTLLKSFGASLDRNDQHR